MCVCVCVCVCLCVCVCEFASVRVCECASVCVCECASVRVCECVSVWVCGVLYVYIYIYIYSFIHNFLSLSIYPAFLYTWLNCMCLYLWTKAAEACRGQEANNKIHHEKYACIHISIYVLCICICICVCVSIYTGVRYWTTCKAFAIMSTSTEKV